MQPVAYSQDSLLEPSTIVSTSASLQPQDTDQSILERTEMDESLVSEGSHVTGKLIYFDYKIQIGIVIFFIQGIVIFL